MEPDCQGVIAGRIRQSGPITVAEFMDLALYAPDAGYYARASQRSGRAGDFVTSVDVSPLFGELLSIQFGEFWRTLGSGPCRLVEAGAGNGRLARDVLDAAARRDPDFHQAVSLHLVERSAAARAAQRQTLGPHAHMIAGSTPDLPGAVTGILYANELIDAFPVHLVTMTGDGLREVFVDLEGEGFIERTGAPSTARLGQYFDDLGIALEPGARAEVNLAAVDWIRQAAASLERGFVVLIDYGYQARTLYGDPDGVETLTAFARQMADPPGGGRRGTPSWLVAPGTRDLTSHVDFTTLRREAAAAGLTPLGMVSQSRFLLDLVERGGLAEALSGEDRLRDRLALKSLLVPGGLGSSHTVLVFAKDVRV